MNRRDFFKLSGLGAAAMFMPPFHRRAIPVCPSNFEQTLATAQSKDTLLLASGIYPITAQVLEVRCNLIADSGARPVLVRANGYTPSLTCWDDVIVDGLWLGGVRDDTTERGYVQFRKRVIFRNNVIWNYYGGVNDGGGGTGNVFRRNVFVNCGTATHHHSIYINNSNPLHTAFVLENIFIGGQAYHIHLWHGPTNTLINGNFSADADNCLVLQGKDNTASNNVFWKPTSPGYPVSIAGGGVNNVYKRNYHGPITQGSNLNGHKDWFGAWNFDGRGVTCSNNHYYPLTQEADKAPVIVTPDNELIYLGKTAAEIDGAVSALKTAFAGTLQDVQANTSISGYVNTLQSVINKWAGQ